MEQVELAAETREGRGKGAARRLRRDGRVPAVIYGHGRAAKALAVEGRELERVLGSGHRVIRIREGDRVLRALIREVQVQPVTQRLLHVDFVEVSAEDMVTLSVPVRFSGQPEGAKDGGVIDIAMHEVSITCRADAVVDELKADLSRLRLGEALHVSDVEMPEGVHPAAGTVQLAVAVCRRPRGEAEAEAAEVAAEAAPAQPEVISETKREEREKEQESDD